MDEFENLTTRGRSGFARLPRRLPAIAVLAVAAAVLLFNAFFTVDQGYRGVHLRLGAVVGIAQPGLGIKVPFLDRVVMIRVPGKYFAAQRTF